MFWRKPFPASCAASPTEPSTSIYATPLADFSAGMHLVQGILLALLQRKRPVRASRLPSASILPCLPCRCRKGTVHMMRNKELNWGAFPLTVCLRRPIAPSSWSVHSSRNLAGHLQGAEIEDLSANPRYANSMCRCSTARKLQTVFRKSSRRTRPPIGTKRLERWIFHCAPVRTIAKRGRRADADQPHDSRRGRNGSRPHPPDWFADRLSAAPVSVRVPPPRLGEHNAEILASISANGREDAHERAVYGQRSGARVTSTDPTG